MKQPSLFGTDGIRGKAGLEPITAQTALRLAAAAATQLRTNHSPAPHQPPTVLIARDTRSSGEFLEAALSAGFLASGVNVVLAGILPTPGLAFLTRSLRASGGVMVSASHNAAEDNGIKFFRADGHKFTLEQELEIEDLLARSIAAPQQAPSFQFGRSLPLEGAAPRYIEFAKASFPFRLTLAGIRIALDCANGAASFTSPAILRELGAEVIPFHSSPDGTNINQRCGSTCPDVLSNLVLQTQAHIGISHDGDADRVLLADETGTPLDGDDILAIAALDLIAKGRLPHNTVAATVMSNFALDALLASHGARLLRTPVGDRAVSDAIESHGLSLGGEQSGHIIFREFSTTGDGIISALQILRIMVETGKPLSELRRCLKKFPQILRNIPVREKPPLDTLPTLRSILSHIEAELEGRGRVLLRYSGTEPKLRILLEGPDLFFLEEAAARIAEEIQRLIGA